MATAYNFSKLKTREKRLYSINDLKLSSTGFATTFVGILCALVAVSFVMNILICAIMGVWYINPLTEDGFDLTGLAITLAIPIGLACLLYYCKIQSYRVYEFLIIYFKPKPIININGKTVKDESYSFDAYLEQQ